VDQVLKRRKGMRRGAERLRRKSQIEKEKGGEA
jgi:hypothetical protein